MRTMSPAELRDLATCIERNIAHATSEVIVEGDVKYRYFVGEDVDHVTHEMRQAKTVKMIIEVELFGALEQYEGGIWVNGQFLGGIHDR